MMRTGAPFEYADSTPMMPGATPMSTLPEMHRLLRLAAALRPEDLENEAVLLEDAGALADLRDRRVPVAALPGGDLQRVLRLRGAEAGSAAAATSTRAGKSRMTIESSLDPCCRIAGERRSRPIRLPQLRANHAMAAARWVSPGDARACSLQAGSGKERRMPTWLMVVAWLGVGLGVGSALIVALDIVAGHRQRMAVMNLVWPLTALYSGLLGAWAYFMIGREGGAPADAGARRGPRFQHG